MIKLAHIYSYKDIEAWAEKIRTLGSDSSYPLLQSICGSYLSLPAEHLFLAPSTRPGRCPACVLITRVYSGKYYLVESNTHSTKPSGVWIEDYPKEGSYTQPLFLEYYQDISTFPNPSKLRALVKDPQAKSGFQWKEVAQ